AAKIGYRVSVNRRANARIEMEGSRCDIAGLRRVADEPPSGPARRLLVIHNPAAGRRSARRWRRFLDHLARLAVPVVLRETAKRGDAEAFARAADPGEFDAVVAAGGDGTVNEVVSGLADGDLPLAVMPLGTANVLANEIGLPRNPKHLATIAATGPARPIWTGELACATGARPF